MAHAPFLSLHHLSRLLVMPGPVWSIWPVRSIWSIRSIWTVHPCNSILLSIFTAIPLPVSLTIFAPVFLPIVVYISNVVPPAVG